VDRIIDISIAVSLLEAVHSMVTNQNALQNGEHRARTLVRIESPFVTKIESESYFRDKFRVHGQFS
jgi:hypothetical protein